MARMGASRQRVAAPACLQTDGEIFCKRVRAPKVHVVVNALLVDAVGSQKSCARSGVDEFGVDKVFVDALEAVMREANSSRPPPGFASPRFLDPEPRAP